MSKRYECPNCGSSNTLWEGVVADATSWRSLMVDGSVENVDRSEVQYGQWQSDGEFGCGECGWNGRKLRVVDIGVDGEPLSEVHPQQQKFL